MKKKDKLKTREVSTEEKNLPETERDPKESTASELEAPVTNDSEAKTDGEDAKGEAAVPNGTENGVSPFTSQIVKSELKRERNKIRFKRLLRSTVYGLVIVAAVAALIATLVLPVIQISGDSMDPTLKNGDIVVLVKTTKMDRGDLCAFSYSNKILIKRVVGLPGDSITVDTDGTVYINGYALEEPYVSEKGLGECDIEFPYTVPENEYFVMGDHRMSSIDSRSSAIGCVPYEQLMGKILFTVWPFESIGIPN